LQLEELAATTAEDETKTEAARVEVSFTRHPATRRNFPRRSAAPAHPSSGTDVLSMLWR
jgi:hypothetical protein